MDVEHAKLMDFLKSEGWKQYPTMDKVYPELIKELWAKKFDDVQICLDFTCLTIHSNTADFISVSITGEVNNTWFKVEAYSMNISHFLKNHTSIIHKLLSSWEKLNELNSIQK